jgi:hypothetical protein
MPREIIIVKEVSSGIFFTGRNLICLDVMSFRSMVT